MSVSESAYILYPVGTSSHTGTHTTEEYVPFYLHFEVPTVDNSTMSSNSTMSLNSTMSSNSTMSGTYGVSTMYNPPTSKMNKVSTTYNLVSTTTAPHYMSTSMKMSTAKTTMTAPKTTEKSSVWIPMETTLLLATSEMPMHTSMPIYTHKTPSTVAAIKESTGANTMTFTNTMASAEQTETVFKRVAEETTSYVKSMTKAVPKASFTIDDAVLSKYSSYLNANPTGISNAAMRNAPLIMMILHYCF